MQEYLNGSPAPKWAFNIAMVALIALMSWFVSDRKASAEVAELEDRVITVEQLGPRLTRIEDKIDDLDQYLRERD